MILLIGYHDDPHLIKIQKQLSVKNYDAAILAVDRDILLQTEFTYSNDSYYITQNNQIFQDKDITAAFCLTPLYQRHYDPNLSRTEDYWFITWREVLYGFYHALSVKSALINGNTYHAIAAQSKEKLYSLARQSGLAVPHSLITNQPEEIEKFFNQYHEIVIKTLHQTNLWVNDQSTMLLVKKVTTQDFSSFQSIGEAPLFLQQAINKAYDLRVIIVGEESIFCKIDANHSEIGYQDWRAYDLPNTKHEIVHSDELLKQKLQKLMRLYKLDYACIDLCVDHEDQVWILDVNPFGRFLWIENLLDVAISNVVANYLIAKTK